MLTKAGEFRRGWKVLAASCAGSSTGVAVLSAYSLGALVGPLGQQFGWTRAQVTAAALATALGYLVSGFGVGAIADRLGARVTAIVSQGLLVGGLVAMALLPLTLPLFYGGYFLLALLGAGTLPMTWSRGIIGWFSAARGLALGVSLVGTGLVGGFLPTMVSLLVAHWGWRGAYLGLAALPLLIGMPLTIAFFRERAGGTGASGTGDTASGGAPAEAEGVTFGQAASDGRYWRMCAAFFLAAVGVSAVLVHALPLLLDRGFSAVAAAAMAGMFGLAVTGGRLVSGYLLDVVPGQRVAMTIFALAALACAVLAACGAHGLLCAASIAVVGLAAGAEADIAGYLTARYFGRRHFGAIYGMLYALYCLGSGVGPLVAGVVYDTTRSYQSALSAGVVLFLAAAALAATLGGSAPRRA